MIGLSIFDYILMVGLEEGMTLFRLQALVEKVYMEESLLVIFLH